ncbi:MAG: nitroreductase family protein [Eubacterium sp.]
MQLIEAIDNRHSVRRYKNKPLEKEVVSALKEEIDYCNTVSGLNIQLVTNESKAFEGFMAHYGKFSGVTNYIAMVGKKGNNLEEKCGYYGERLVLKAQQLGLNTCWVALTYSKNKAVFTVNNDEKLCVVITIGYGESQGIPHKSKAISQVSESDSKMPDWFINGVKSALLAPTAMNQQKFKFIFEDDRVIAKAGIGFYTKIDLGIVKYHFEIGAGKENFEWINR